MWLQIEDNDILFKWYMRAHKNSGIKPKPPTNLCPYFKTAIRGLVLTVIEDIKLWKLWATASVCIATILLLARLEIVDLSAPMFSSNNALLFFLFYILLLLPIMAAFCASIITLSSKVSFKTVLTIILLSFFATIASIIYFEGLSFFLYVAKRFATVSGIFVALMVGITLSLSLVVFAVRPIVTLKFFQTIVAFLKSTARHLCVTVIPPPSMKNT